MNVNPSGKHIFPSPVCGNKSNGFYVPGNISTALVSTKQPTHFFLQFLYNTAMCIGKSRPLTQRFWHRLNGALSSQPNIPSGYCKICNNHFISSPTSVIKYFFTTETSAYSSWTSQYPYLLPPLRSILPFSCNSFIIRCIVLSGIWVSEAKSFCAICGLLLIFSITYKCIALSNPPSNRQNGGLAFWNLVLWRFGVQ